MNSVQILNTQESYKIVFAQSPTFSPTALAGFCRYGPLDVVLVSNDCMLFHLHSQRLLQVSNNAFGALLSHHNDANNDTFHTIVVNEASVVLEVVLRAIYSICLETCPTSFETLCSAIRSLKKYGADLPALIAPRTPLMERLLGLAPLHGIELYVFAAEHDLEVLAKSASSYALSCSLAFLSDELVQTMGAHYLMRLHDLQLARLLELRGLLFVPPIFHPLKPHCTLSQQRRLTGAWALATARIAWQMSPGTRLHFWAFILL